MSIGRNYRLELEKRLREIHTTRDNLSSLKIVDKRDNCTKPTVLLNSKKRKSKSEFDVETKKNNKSSGFVSLAVNQ